MSKINYLQIFADGHTEASTAKPSWGMYSKESADDNRPIYIDGKWHSTSGGELVTNGSFDTDVSGWIPWNGASESGSILSVENNTLKVVSSVPNGGARTKIVAEVGQVNKASYDVVYTNDLIAIYSSVAVYTDDTYTTLSNIYSMSGSGSLSLGKREVEFTPLTPYVAVIVLTGATAGKIVNIDNVTCYKTKPTIGTAYDPQFTYASESGKLLGVEVANGDVVDLHYDEYHPDLVEDTIQATNLVVTDGFDLGQTWQDVTSERASGVTYTNDTGKTIEVSVVTSLGNNTTLEIDGIIVSRFNPVDADYTNLTGTVPNKSEYKATLNGNALRSWVELR